MRAPAGVRRLCSLGAVLPSVGGGATERPQVVRAVATVAAAGAGRGAAEPRAVASSSARLGHTARVRMGSPAPAAEASRGPAPSPTAQAAKAPRLEASTTGAGAAARERGGTRPTGPPAAAAGARPDSFKRLERPAPAPGTAPKVVMLSGPTGVGKTATSLRLAELLGAEIISADSVQVYRGLDIGSDKLPVAERKGIPHHLLDIRDPQEEYSAGDFHDDARRAVVDVLGRGATPLVVGGTAFYLKLFVNGKPDTPPPDPAAAAAAKAALAAAREKVAADLGREPDADEAWEAALGALRDAGDPGAADAIARERNNYFRLERALQVRLGTGKTRAELAVKGDAPLDYDFRGFFLYRPRIECFRRIDARVEEMLSGGLLREAMALLDLGVSPEDGKCAARAIGYRQAMQFLQARSAEGTRGTAEDVRQLVYDISAASRNLGKAQVNWFRENPAYQWVDATRDPEELAQYIAQEVAKPAHEAGCADANWGYLSKAEHQELRRYTQQLRVFDDAAACERVLDEAQRLLAG